MRYRHFFQLGAIGATASLVTLLFFCPKFAFWKTLPADEIGFLPDVNRARFALQQLNDPFIKIDDPENRALQWRLLFPLVGHYLHLPPKVFLALPWVGCVLALMLIAHLVTMHRGNWWRAFFAALLAATSSWFFVSTGWLSYPDSWFILALIVVAFVPSRAALLIACLLGPWIDERFVIGLPLAVVVRGVFFTQVLDRPIRWLRADALAVAAPVIAYLIARVALFHSSDSSTYLTDEAVGRVHKFATVWPRALLGVWMALRVEWVLVFFAIVFVWRSKRRMAAIAIVAMMIATTGVCLFVANDLSRSFALMTPVFVLGLVMLLKHRPRRATAWLAVLAGANLLLPASHVVYKFTVPIEGLYAEIDRWNHPPDFALPMLYVQNGATAIREGKLDDARRSFGIALKLDPHNMQALLDRAWLNLQTNDIAAAIRDADMAVQANPGSADALYTSATAHLRNGELPLAADRATRALQNCPPDWPHRFECAALLDRINQMKSD